ncbi:MAG TPA: type II toxin-antitoxin system VapC family toxin [Sphingopyxis sp.]|nr:type II toxin-antitoxin system VapC family toxin [Sphingopyxis sp.]HMP45380.1 type II toxin-antitoxin system VapC family toxin [Sphingopyxis sp.]HMQ18473.1 type II toxin-antitoxin system VapC family toxin [Sphingopyxis sp.]
MRLLIDTQILVWLVIGDKRLRPIQQKALFDPGNQLFVSAAIAFEYCDLQTRKRLPVDESLTEIESRFGMSVIDYPADAWRAAIDLPKIHRDPVDRMLIAHALTEGMTLVTADANIRRYPVPFV